SPSGGRGPSTSRPWRRPARPGVPAWSRRPWPGSPASWRSGGMVIARAGSCGTRRGVGRDRPEREGRVVTRLRVAHVIDSLAGSGGAENRLVDEAVALAGRFDQIVVRLFEQDQLDERLADAGIEVVPLGFRAARAARTWPLAARRVRAILRPWRPDVVHTSLVTGNLVGQLAARGLGVP